MYLNFMGANNGEQDCTKVDWMNSYQLKGCA